MALVNRGDYHYADTQADLREEIIRYSKLNTYEATHFADAVCRAPARPKTKPKAGSKAKAEAKPKKTAVAPPAMANGQPGAECGGRLFTLTFDDGAGAAVRKCVLCKDEHPIGDSADYLDEADLDEAECVCESPKLEITVGVSLYADSEDVRWLYLGCRCPKCKVAGVYADWKNEFNGFQKLLANV